MSVGQILAEKYRLIEQLSRGGMGSVWRAEHIELGTPAAVKLIDPVLAETEEALLRFRHEAQAAASLRSANIVQIFDYGVAGGTPYIAMELLRGQSLAQRLAEGAPVSALETAIILSQVGKAVAWAHSMGIVHRDLKPDNVFLAEDADETVVKLLDFGIAKSFEVRPFDTPKTITGAMIGTPFYMSPEQAGGKRIVDSRSDVWAFAVIAFECLTGKRPFNSETLGGLVLCICSEPLPVPSSIAEVPSGFDEWFARTAHRELSKRTPTIREAARELRKICIAGLEDEALGPISNSGIHSGPGCPTSCGSSTIVVTESLANSATMVGSNTTAWSGGLTRYRKGLLIGGVGCVVAGVLFFTLNRKQAQSNPLPAVVSSTVAKESSAPPESGAPELQPVLMNLGDESRAPAKGLEKRFAHEARWALSDANKVKHKSIKEQLPSNPSSEVGLPGAPRDKNGEKVENYPQQTIRDLDKEVGF